MAFWLIPVDRAAAMMTISALDTPSSAKDVEVVDGIVYIADVGTGPTLGSGSGLRIIDVWPESAPIVVPALGVWSRVLLLFAFAAIAASALRLRHAKQ